MKLSIIVVNYNTKKITEDCLRSIDKFPFTGLFEVVVVDNASTDGSRELLSKFKSKKYAFRYIYNSQNLGFSKANNIGIKKAKGAYILLLNSDTLVLENSLNKLYEFALINPTAGVVVPRLLNVDKSIQPSVYRLPTLWRAVREFWLRKSGLGEKYSPESETPVVVEAAVAAAFLITPKARKKVGLLNEKYFMYFEDLDYCRSVNKAGLKVYYLPAAKIVHLHGKSGQKVAAKPDQWKRLVPSSKIYHGVLVHYARWFIMRTSQSREIIALAALVAGALIIRFVHFPANVYFAYDQARDAFMADEILHGDFKLMGPPSSFRGLFHGPLYWYLISPMYLLFAGNPASVSGLLRLINLLTIPLIFLVGKTLFNKRVGLFAAIIFAFSFENWQTSLYFSNPSLAFVTVLVFYYALSRIIKAQDKLWDWLLLAIGLGASIQMQFYMVYLFFILIATFLIHFGELKKRITLGKLFAFMVTSLLFLSTFLVTELKYGFRQTNEVLSTFGIDDGKNAADGLGEWLDRVAISTKDNLGLGIPLVAVLLFLVVTFIRLHRNSRKPFAYLLVWILGSLSLFLISSHNVYYVVGLSAPIVIFASVFVSEIFLPRKVRPYVLLIIVVLNLLAIYRQAREGIVEQISVQRGMSYGDEKAVVDYIYNNANDQEFAVNALTMPYDIYTTWAYIFQNYGGSKYGFVPYWVKSQVEGFPGKLPVSSKTVCVRYTIFESLRGHERLEKFFREEQDLTTNLDSRIKIGEFTVEKRIDKACL